MTWDITKAAFKDELEKIAEINLSGVTPERLSSMFEGAPPMETVGYEQAKAVLMKRQQMQKTAATPIPRLPQLKRLTRPGFKNEDGPPPDAIDKMKRLGGHILAGAGAGRFAAEFTPHAVEPKRKFIGTAIGAGLGAAEFARKAYRQRKFEKSKTANFSPNMALKAGQQVGMKMNARPTGMTSISNIVPKIKAPPSMPHTGVPNLV